VGRVQDRVVVVTGGAGGIGSTACRAIAAEGGKVVVADLDASAAKSVAEEIVADGGSATSVGVDVTDRPQVQAMVRTAVETFGRLDVIFNNAGMNRPRDFLEIDEQNFDEIVHVNAWGVIVCTQEAARQMIAQGSGGKIVNTGSIASRQGYWEFVPYCVAKFGTLAITQATHRCGSVSTRTSGRSTTSPKRRTRCTTSAPPRWPAAQRHPRNWPRFWSISPRRSPIT
jgi:meso-butanediol dehydrogenase / (S,S)-butanediol dehydrogenase / diacetyl reductase